MIEKKALSAEELTLRREFTEKAAAVIAAKYSHTPLAFVHTYGCQQNVSDSERMKGMLRDIGFDFTDDVEQADLVLFNTCAVREHAENRVFGNVGALKSTSRSTVA